MGNRWYRLAVLVLWLSTTAWLVETKILPPYLRGEPPMYSTMSANRPAAPIGWQLNFNDARLGWALSEIVKQPNDTTEVRSLIHFNDLPLEQFLPTYLQGLARGGARSLGHLEMEVESKLLIDPLNHLVSFDSLLRPKRNPVPRGQGQVQSLVHITGNVEGTKLRLSVRVGEQGWEPELPLPENMVGDSLSPQMVLPGLRLGQSWTIVSYSPMALASRPLEFIQGRPPTEVLFAKVEEVTPTTFDGRIEPMWLVVFRSDINSGAGNEKNVRNRLWVRRDGTVVRQQVVVGENTLTFLRMTDPEAAKLREEHKEFQQEALPGAHP